MGETSAAMTPAVAAITTICVLIGEAVKASPLDNKYIPVIVGICGGLLGIGGQFIIPGFPAEDLISAAAVGIASGLASTGLHQARKQLKEPENENA